MTGEVEDIIGSSEAAELLGVTARETIAELEAELQQERSRTLWQRIMGK